MNRSASIFFPHPSGLPCKLHFGNPDLNNLVSFPTQKLKINGCSTRRALALIVWLAQRTPGWSLNFWIVPKLSVFCSSRVTLHPEVRNESRLPEWVFCCHLEESLVDSIQNWGSLCLHVSLYSHHPQMEWQFSASADIQACDCEVLHNYSSRTNFTWKPWQLQVGGSCVFLWTALFCVGRRNKLYSLMWKGKVF